MSFTLSQLIPAIPEVFVTIMIAVTILVSLFLGEKHRNATFYLTQATLLICTLLTVNIFHHQTQIAFHNSFIVDHMACILKVFVYAMTFLSLLYAQPYLRGTELGAGEFYILTLFVVLGMMVLISAYSFITLFIGLELFSLPLYAMIAMQRTAVTAEAAMKYFVLGSSASAFLLFGMSMVYGATGALTIPDIQNAVLLHSPTIAILGLIFILAAVAFKLGAAPFHMWIPDVYEGAPLPVTLILASATKIAAFVLAIRLLVNALPLLTNQWQHMLIFVAILSMLIGNLVAIVQTNIRRMLAYSSIAQMGYMLLGLVSGIGVGFGAAMFYIIVYAIMSLGAFGVLMLISRTGFEVHSINDLRGLNRRNPWLAFMMLLVMFSMAGIPPSAGFFAKIAVLVALVHVHLVWLAALALIFAIIGAYYYLCVVKVMYFEEPEETSLIEINGLGKQLGISVNCLMVLVLGILPTGLFQLCQAAFVGG
ncbi:MAG: NADH-quinone oxidoreductase subunit NuoN [Legionellales bacterium]|nr:NADH-quinone oxidoreductase subunit NuoN [Legionellales bacterium]